MVAATAVALAGSTKEMKGSLVLQDLLTIRNLIFARFGSCRSANHSNTYCANHPYRNPGRTEVPIGPVWEGRPDNIREIWKLSPDAEEVRLTLLALLRQIEENLQSEYPIGISVDDTVVWQLGEFREKRAVDELRRIIGFSTDKEYEDGYGLKWTRRKAVQLAHEALEKIEETRPLEWTQEPEFGPHPNWRLGPPYCGCDICRSDRQAMGVQIPESLIGESPEEGEVGRIVAEADVYAKAPWWKRILGR